MQILEVNMRLPYKERGSILGRLLSKVGGRIKDIHFLPPDATGMSEVRMELVGDRKLIQELRKIVKDGKLSFKVLSEA
ncbi:MULTISPECIES: hypothetical protein [Thermococcus]|uniref:Uncharacterized protein n=1 Tax=Thermococcus nautili TaxID=195522 RepID=W8NTK0_9EURY|nr:MULTISPECIES: hypothetical protein [Thermococcus]AHL22593.1 hypothetical protein BD01_0974 [Thermococcus nautili]NJE48147.1 hypothetical protein [Thermococcus sp. 9N3]